MHIRRKRIFLGVATVITIGLGVYAWQTMRQPVALPQDFLRARREAGAISAQVVAITGDVHTIVGEINATERAGAHDEARARIADARAKNETARQLTLELTNRLRVLAESFGEIPSPQSQRLALQAVSAELAVAGEYLMYTSNLNAFFDALAVTAGNSTTDQARLVQEALDAVNGSAARINELNAAALAALARFDASL